jgi:hypothetical protein
MTHSSSYSGISAEIRRRNRRDKGVKTEEQVRKTEQAERPEKEQLSTTRVQPIV